MNQQTIFEQLINRFVQAADLDTLLLLTLKHPDQLLTAEAVSALEQYKQTLSEDDGRATLLAQLNDIYHDSRENYYFELFTSVRSRGGMRQLRMLIDDEGLDAIEYQASKVLVIDENVGRMVEERLNDLQALRQQSIADLELIHAEEEARLNQATAMLPLVEKVERWLNSADWDDALAYLNQHHDELLSDQAAGILLALVAENGQDEQTERYLLWHKRAREIGVEAAYAELRVGESSSDVDLSVIEDKLVAWLQAPGPLQAEAYLTIHAADLLTDEAETVLALLQKKNPNHHKLIEHQKLLKACREQGIEAVYRG